MSKRDGSSLRKKFFTMPDIRHAWTTIVPHPLRLNIEDGLWIQGAILWTAFGRGVDYLDTQPGSATSSLSVIEQAAPLFMWGLFLIAGVALVVSGMTTKQKNFIWLAIAGHSALAIAYLLLGTGQLIAIADRPFLDGFRTGFGLLVAGTIIHWRMATSLHRHYILGVKQ